MSNIIEINNTQVVFEQAEGGVFTDSKTIAEVFSKEHKRILQTIREDEAFDEFIGQYKIVQSSYINSQNKEQPLYLLDRDSFSYFVMGFTGAEAKQWKLAYIKAFNMMEKKLTEPQTPQIETKKEALDLEMTALKHSIDILKVNDSGKVFMIEKVYNNYGLPTNVLPTYSTETVTFASAQLLEVLGVKV
jgi:Rha family phage regulatory protein